MNARANIAIDYGWLNDYVGLPYQLNGRERTGTDCYGLLCMVFRDQRGIDLPDWRAADGSAIAAIKVLQSNLAGQIENGNAIEISAPIDWAIVTVHRATRAHHIGVCMRGGVLHSDHAFGCEWSPMARFKFSYPWQLRFWQWQV